MLRLMWRLSSAAYLQHLCVANILHSLFCNSYAGIFYNTLRFYIGVDCVFSSYIFAITTTIKKLTYPKFAYKVENKENWTRKINAANKALNVIKPKSRIYWWIKVEVPICQQSK